MNMTKLKVAFRNFANAPKSHKDRFEGRILTGHFPKASRMRYCCTNRNTYSKTFSFQ